MDCRLCISNGERIVEKKAPAGERISQDDRIRTDGCDDVGPRDEVLSLKRLQGAKYEECPENEFEWYFRDQASNKK